MHHVSKSITHDKKKSTRMLPMPRCSYKVKVILNVICSPSDPENVLCASHCLETTNSLSVS
jgi:hypothetical protein